MKPPPTPAELADFIENLAPAARAQFFESRETATQYLKTLPESERVAAMAQLFGVSEEEIEQSLTGNAAGSIEETVRAERRIARLMLESDGVMLPPSVPVRGDERTALIEMAQFFWPHSYGRADSDTEAMHVLQEHSRIQSDSRLAAALSQPGIFFYMLSCALWKHQAFPIVEVGERLAASLMSTRVTEDMVAYIAPPFRSFVIRIPPTLLSSIVEGRRYQIQYVLASRIRVDLPDEPSSSSAAMVEQLRRDRAEPGMNHVDHWNYWAHAGPGTLHGYKMPARELAAGGTSVSGMREAFEVELDDEDERTHEILKRLVAGVCLACSDPTHLKKPKPSRRAASHNKRDGGAPTLRHYRLMSPIVTDCRGPLADYLAGKRRTAPSVQTLVAGHWKRQPHGPNGTLRKTIHIEPYWRGDVAAPIALRSRRL